MNKIYNQGISLDNSSNQILTCNGMQTGTNKNYLRPFTIHIMTSSWHKLQTLGKSAGNWFKWELQMRFHSSRGMVSTSPLPSAPSEEIQD